MEWEYLVFKMRDQIPQNEGLVSLARRKFGYVRGKYLYVSGERWRDYFVPERELY